MKLINPPKNADYWHYLCHQYYDELVCLSYGKIESNPYWGGSSLTNEPVRKTVIIAFCNRLYYGVYKSELNKVDWFINPKELSRWDLGEYHSHHLMPTDHNIKNNFPFLMFRQNGFSDTDNILLKNYNFQDLFPPEKAFVEIYNFLSRGNDRIPEPTDDIKILAKGYDKTSFRDVGRKRRK